MHSHDIADQKKNISSCGLIYIGIFDTNEYIFISLFFSFTNGKDNMGKEQPLNCLIIMFHL